MSNDSAKIMLVEDHAVVRLGLKTLIEKNTNMIVCAEAETLQEAYLSLSECNPDLVLLDIKLPDGSGIGGCKRIKKISPTTKVIILTAYAENHIIIDSIKAGAEGFLLKNANGDVIISAIEDVMNGKSVLDSSIADIIFKQVKDTDKNVEGNLSVQDQQILEYICHGKTNREIGQNLFISEKTVRNYVSRIMKKIGVTNRTEAAAYWSGQKSLR
ncbi:MAG: response regulator [Sedimentibacter sp.]